MSLDRATRLASSASPRHIRDGFYKPAGFKCPRCEFTSTKTGFSGRQALRAHSKKHKRDRRAWFRPFVSQGMVVLTVAGVGVAGWLMPLDEPLFTLPFDLISMAVAAVTGLLLLLSAALLHKGAGKRDSKMASLLVIIGTISGIWGAALASGLIAPRPSLVMEAPIWVLLAITPSLAARVGLMRLSIRRREGKTRSALLLLKPKDKDYLDLIWMQERRERVEAGSKRCEGCGVKFEGGIKIGRRACSGCGTPLPQL